MSGKGSSQPGKRDRALLTNRILLENRLLDDGRSTGGKTPALRTTGLPQTTLFGLDVTLRCPTTRLAPVTTALSCTWK